ncbi:uncharacterized protein [Dysidea avara]|uniref:uncharacterized protein n=1 Tax=Dysidea avara TaxID=196820 RepID=UPI003320C85C
MSIALQQLWQECVDWDAPLYTPLNMEWHTIAGNITDAMTFSLPRKYAASIPPPENTTTVLHVFADVSLKAYGAAAYIQQNNQPASFVMSKSRAVPLKQITLPKLELMAAVLAARLSEFVRTSLSIDCVLYLWSDSQIILYWITSQKKLKPFVDHKVSEIRSISTNWKYCPSADNPADLLTRGISTQQLASAALWQQGPSWLLLQDQWPTWNPSSETLLIQMQEELDDQPIEQILVHSALTSPANFLQVMDVTKYSSLQKLLAVTAYVLHFINTTRQLSHNTGHLTTFELAKAKLKWLYTIQHEVFPEEIANLQSLSHSRLPLVQQLRLFLDDDQLLRSTPQGRPYQTPDPPPLLKCRVNAVHPFEVTGVDFTGALYVRCSDGEQKVYVCLFTCATFQRFTSRRSLSKVMISDNATTFLAAGEELQSVLSSAALADNLAKRGVEWRFIPKRTPWFGGFWERCTLQVCFSGAMEKTSKHNFW